MFRFFVFLTALLPFSLHAAEAAENATTFGVLTLLPPLLAIALAFLTKNVILSLFFGVFSGTFLLNITGNDVFTAVIVGFVDITSKIIGAMADSWNAGIILQVLTIGGLVALITKMGGTKAVAEYLAKKAKSRVSAQISTWVMGLFVFFDDYANALIVGPIMRPITDKFKISREKLAFIIDATAAPIAGIAIISTWVGYEISLIKDAYGLIEITNINAFSIFVETIPYRFYNLFMLFFVVMTALMQREFGPMYAAEVRARQKGLVIGEGSRPMINTEDKTVEPKEGIKLSIWNAIVPLLVLMISAFVGFYYNGYATLEGELLAQVNAAPLSFLAIRETFGAADASVVLFQAALLASLVAMVMGIYNKIFKAAEAIDTWLTGLKSLLITVVILLLAWSLSSVIKELGTSKYLVELLSESIPKAALPSAIFVLASFISFSTGTSYGTMGILMPLSIPLAHAIGAQYGLEAETMHTYMIMNIGAVLTGAIFGDHCSPISDTTILSSMGAACDHIDHTRTQIVYALAVGLVAVAVGYLPVALGLSVLLTLPLGLLAIFLMVRFIGKKVPA